MFSCSTTLKSVWSESQAVGCFWCTGFADETPYSSSQHQYSGDDGVNKNNILFTFSKNMKIIWPYLGVMFPSAGWYPPMQSPKSPWNRLLQVSNPLPPRKIPAVDLVKSSQIISNPHFPSKFHLNLHSNGTWKMGLDPFSPTSMLRNPSKSPSSRALLQEDDAVAVTAPPPRRSDWKMGDFHQKNGGVQGGCPMENRLFHWGNTWCTWWFLWQIIFRVFVRLPSCRHIECHAIRWFREGNKLDVPFAGAIAWEPVDSGKLNSRVFAPNGEWIGTNDASAWGEIGFSPGKRTISLEEFVCG